MFLDSERLTLMVMPYMKSWRLLGSSQPLLGRQHPFSTVLTLLFCFLVNIIDLSCSRDVFSAGLSELQIAVMVLTGGSK